MTKPHTLFKIVISLIVLAVYGGCQVQDIDIPEDYGTTKGLREVIITAQAEDLATDTATRTETELVIGDDNKWTYPMYWLQGDKIMIYSAGEASEFTSINTEKTRVAKFKGLCLGHLPVKCCRSILRATRQVGKRGHHRGLPFDAAGKARFLRG